MKKVYVLEMTTIHSVICLMRNNTYDIFNCLRTVYDTDHVRSMHSKSIMIIYTITRLYISSGHRYGIHAYLFTMLLTNMTAL